MEIPNQAGQKQRWKCSTILFLHMFLLQIHLEDEHILIRTPKSTPNAASVGRDWLVNCCSVTVSIYSLLVANKGSITWRFRCNQRIFTDRCILYEVEGVFSTSTWVFVRLFITLYYSLRLLIPFGEKIYIFLQGFHMFVFVLVQITYCFGYILRKKG